MEALATIINKEQSSAEIIGMLILEELRMMRKDVNNGILKLQRKFENLTAPFQQSEPSNVFFDEGSSEEEDLNISNYAEKVKAKELDFNKGGCPERVLFNFTENDSLSTNQARSSIDQVFENMQVKRELHTGDDENIAAVVDDSHLKSFSFEQSSNKSCNSSTHSTKAETKNTNDKSGDASAKSSLNSHQISRNIDQICESMRVKQKLFSASPNTWSTVKVCEKICKSPSKPSASTSNSSKMVQPSIVESLKSPSHLQLQTLNQAIDCGIMLTPISHVMQTTASKPSVYTEKYKLNHVCKICMKSHSSSHKLKRHYIEVHNHTNKNICHYCGRSCFNSTDLKVHIRTHTGEKPYQCDICEKAFADKSNYTRHCRMRKGLSCVVCSKIVCTKLQMYQHNAIHRS